jgi:molybdopterin converting factor small subunit
VTLPPTFPVALAVPDNWKTVVGCDLPQLQCEAGTVRDVLDWLTAAYPDLRKRLFAGNADRVACWVNVYLNEENIRDLDGLSTVISGSSTVTILHAVAGG